MVDSASSGEKRKNPPTFHHYPTNRAKALKKAWVEKTKIKTKWKAEKRKEDLASSYKLDIPVYSDDDGPNSAKKSTTIPDPQETSYSPSTTRAQAHIHHSRAHIHPELPVKRSKSVQSDPEPRLAKRRKISKDIDEDKPAESVSLRELTREAYSRSTLHTFKADPLKKRQSNPSHGGKDRNIGREPSTGRGQPNMKLRMNAMLAKIKQDFA